jgi:hypothetical protein
MSVYIPITGLPLRSRGEHPRDFPTFRIDFDDARDIYLQALNDCGRALSSTITAHG